MLFRFWPGSLGLYGPDIFSVYSVSFCNCSHCCCCHSHHLVVVVVTLLLLLSFYHIFIAIVLTLT